MDPCCIDVGGALHRWWTSFGVECDSIRILVWVLCVAEPIGWLCHLVGIFNRIFGPTIPSLWALFFLVMAMTMVRDADHLFVVVRFECRWSVAVLIDDFALKRRVPPFLK